MEYETVSDDEEKSSINSPVKVSYSQKVLRNQEILDNVSQTVNQKDRHRQTSRDNDINKLDELRNERKSLPESLYWDTADDKELRPKNIKNLSISSGKSHDFERKLTKSREDDYNIRSTRSKEKSGMMDEDNEELTGVSPISKSGKGQKQSYMTEEYFNKFVRTPTPESQSQSNMKEEDFDKFVRKRPVSSYNTRDMTDEDLDVKTTSFYNTGSQKRSDMTGKDFDKFATTNSGHYTRSQKKLDMENEGFDKFGTPYNARDMVDEDFDGLSRGSGLYNTRDVTDGNFNKFATTNSDTRNQKKLNMANEDFDKFAKAKSSYNTRDVTDDDFDKFAKTKSIHNTRSQKKSDIADEDFTNRFVKTKSSYNTRDMTDEDFESNIFANTRDVTDEDFDKIARIKSGYDTTRSQKRSDIANKDFNGFATNEDFDKFAKTKSVHNVKSQKNSHMADEDFNNFIKTPISKSGYGLRNQKEPEMMDEEFDYDDNVGSFQDKNKKLFSGNNHSEFYYNSKKRSDQSLSVRGSNPRDKRNMHDPPTGNSYTSNNQKKDQNIKSQKDLHMADEDFDNFIKTPISKPGYGLRNQKESEMMDEEFDYDDDISSFRDKNDKLFSGNHHSEFYYNSKKRNDQSSSVHGSNPQDKNDYHQQKEVIGIDYQELSNKGLRNMHDPLTSNSYSSNSQKKDQNVKSQKNSHMTDEDFDNFIKTPISKSGYGLRNQEESEESEESEMMDEEFDYDDDVSSFQDKNDKLFSGNHHSEFYYNSKKQNDQSSSVHGSNPQDKNDYHKQEEVIDINYQKLSNKGLRNMHDPLTGNSYSSNNQRNDQKSNPNKGSRANDQEKDQKSNSGLISNVSNIWNKLTSGTKNENEIKVIFHVHLPEGVEGTGRPVIIGSAKEFGSWDKPIVKLYQRNQQSRTYWQSDPVTIPLFAVRDEGEIQYKYAVYVQSSLFTKERIIFEGNDKKDNRILNIKRNNQFDIWKSNNQLKLRAIHNFAFVDYIYNSIKASNLKDKVMEYQHLLTIHNDYTIHESNLNFIISRTDGKSNREKLIFLCLLLGYHISRKQGSSYELQNKFQSGLLLKAFEYYSQETLPSDTKDQIRTAIIALVRHNAFQMQFDWIIIFTIATEVDPNYTFIDHLRLLKYSDDNLLSKFIDKVETIRPYIEGIAFETSMKIAKWLIQLCHNMDYLFKLWSDILLHNNDLDRRIFKCFNEQIRENISRDDAVALEYHFKRIPVDYRSNVTEVFQARTLLLLGSARKWTKEDITAIKELLHDDSLNWGRDEVIQSLESISQSNASELLDIFPELLDDWFRGNFSDKGKKISKICIAWFKNLLIKLGKFSNESDLVLSVFMRLESIYPLLGQRKNIWQNLTALAIERVRTCSELRIFGATKFLIRIKEQEVRMLFVDIIKETLNRTVQQINDQLINKMFTICDCKGTTLEVPNSMSEDILCHIMTKLQSQSPASSPSEHHLNILGASRFWHIILRATGNVTKLHSNPLIRRVKVSINELGGLLREKAIDIQFLQQLLEYSDEELFQHFDAAVAKKKAIGDVIVSRDEITNLRRLCVNYQLQLNVLFKFYTGFCQVANVEDYIQDLKQRMPNSNKVKFNQVLSLDYWAFHKKTLESAKLCYKFNQSQSFRNIFEDCIQKDAAAIRVEYIAQKLVPIVIERYSAICKQFKEWEKLRCSDASLFWKNVTDVNAELNLMEDYKGTKNEKFVQTLDNLSKIPCWTERLEELKTVVELFDVPRNEDDWLAKSIRVLSDDSMKLNQLNSFFDYLYRNLSNVSQDCWKLINELSSADDFIGFLKDIAEHDIKNLINGVDDHSDERLIQEDTVSSLIQVKQFLLPLMDKNKTGDIASFLNALVNILNKNPTLAEKIALCSSNNMALRNMYENISNRGEVTKEKIKNAVHNGTYTFARDEKGDKCSVSLKYVSETSKASKASKTSETNVMIYNINEILDLRGRALLIAKPKISVINDKDEEMSKNAMDEFVVQVDIAQEIVNTVSMLMQMGHFDYREFKKELQGTSEMRNYLKSLKDGLEKWRTIVDRAQEQCYYLTFFPSRYILAFYDYFTSKNLDKENEGECEVLIRFVNSKAKLPSRKDVKGFSHGNDYLKILCEIGNELEIIFRNIPKQLRKLKAAGQGMMDPVRKGKLFVAACTDKTRIPNVIMSLYANHGYYPEPWQLLICTSSTTMEELTIFIKRSFFASNNGYENRLFCIANLELLDFELQYDLVNQIRSMQDKKDYLLALICCRETGMHHHILDQFSSNVHPTDGLNAEAMGGIYGELQNVIRVSSDLSGQGKTEWIKENSFSKEKFPRNFLISDDMVFSRLVRQLKECKLRPVESLHINIVSANYPEDVNMFLFELLTLGIVSTNVDIACLPPSETPTCIFIEIASTTEQHLLNSLPMAGYLLSNHLTWNIKNLKVSQEIYSPIQVTCHYLDLFDRNEVDTKEIFFQTDKAIKEPLPADRCQNLIKKYFFNKDTKDISSFRFVEIFVNVLADQLVRLSSSQFFTIDNLKLMVKETQIRNLILRTLIDVSKDFATRSIKTKVAQLESITADDENARLGTIVQWDDSNHLIVFFNSQTPDTISALYRDRTKVHDNVKILLKSQIIGDPKKWELIDYNSMSANALYVKLECLARTSTGKLDLPEYALSGDNLIKMALILLRARGNIPVIVCGEAGCGKTSLIAYLALVIEVQFQALNLHAGIDEKTIMLFMNDASEKAEKGEIWLFFDEINTCNHIGLLADLISHRMLNGKLIHPNIRLFSACNPYRLRTRAQSEAGLTTKVKKYEEKSNLVYQVKPLPDKILDYVWDYGILKPKDELKYIQIMVEKELKKLADPVFAELLYASQKFIRKVEEPYSVSLRDVKRAITLVKFFYNSLENRPAYRKGHRYPPPGDPNTKLRSYVLALSLCYHSRLYEQDLRKKYRHEMGQILQKHDAYVEERMFATIIREEQEDYINRMQCPPNTAKNEALLENVLVMIVCILTRIPLFLIGAPGSSKSLAIRLISSNLRGSDSNDKYFSKLPQVYLIPHQGSSSSTSDGIKKVFDKANKYQVTTSKQFPVISVVLLDEVGLAETSPFNPLKVLHYLLEPSYPATRPTVSVIGISNWRLDNSKSSRALLVQRPQFDLGDLVDTAERLLNTNGLGQRGALEPLAKAYSDYEKNGQTLPNFHGLRDYYALVKQLSSNEMTPENIQMALARNFGGTENNAKLCKKYFKDILKMFNNHNPWLYKPISTEQLIDSNLDDADARHLMVIGKSDSIVNLLTYQLRSRGLDPVVILGSQFLDDREDYSYNVLRRIMMCVEEGRPLILTDLEMIYGSLYDLWNQNYIVVGSKGNVKYFTRVALGAYANPMLYVNPNFKCILVMDEKNLASADPPLLNRFEKQKMSINDTLNDNQKSLVEILSDWVRKMSTLVGVSPITQLRNRFTQKDLFVGFDKDETLQSLIIDITKNNSEAGNEEILEKCKECLIATASSDGIVRAEQSALERDEVDRWKHVYFNQQYHDSLYDYFDNQLKDPNGHLVIVNTFSNINTDIKACLQGLLSCQVDKLSTFKTEAQLSNRVKHFWLESTNHMLILQCDVTTVNAGCIKLAKFIIEQFRNEFITKKEQEMPIKHACIILHIHRDQESTLASFNFMCGWKQMTIETLSRNDIPTSGLLDGSLSYVINSCYTFERILLQELLWCLSCMKYPSNDKSIDHIKILSEKILEYPNFIECLKDRVLEWIEEKSTNDWQYKVASNKQNLYPYTSFSAALQAHVRTLVRKPIAQILCVLERFSATKTFFHVDDRIKENDERLLEFWKQIYTDKKIVKIEDLPSPKPDGYNMQAGSLLDLEFPFSFYFMKQIDNFRRYYEEEIAILQKDDDRIDNTTNELYDYVIEDHLKDFKDNILTSIPQLKNSPFEWAPELYFNDFVTIIAANNCENRNTKMLALILKLLIGTDKVYQPIFLHAYWWKNANEVLAQLQLAQISPIVIKHIETQGNTVVGGSLEKYLVKEVTKIMLQRICGNFESAVNAHLIDKWQHDVTKVLSLSNKITRAKNLPDLQLLRIINDLVATKTIPLGNIKEIVQLGLSSDEQVVLSEKFISTVLDKLDKLEQNEKNLIPKRSFIMRCLALTPIESDVRLSLYEKLFSSEPFPLMGAIIERIFHKEDIENEDIFFTMITDAEETLRQSARLNIINNCLKDLDTNIATLCCDVIEQTFFINEELENLAPYFGPALEALYRQGRPALQKIISIALLKEFVHRFWDSFLQKDKYSPIAYNKMEEGNFDSNELIDQINNNMTIAHSLVYSLKIYFLRDLCQRDFSIDDIRKFCEAQKKRLPWLGTLNWEDIKENRLSFNPYCNLPEYNEAENSFMTFYSVGNWVPFQKFMQNLKQKMTLTAKLSLMGLFFVRIHALRASREWRHSEMHSADFLNKELAGVNLPNLFKTIATKILSNKQPLLKIHNSGINNTDLLIKSVIAHIIAFHASVEPNSFQLAMYLHRLQDCKNLFILTCTSDMESAVLNAGSGSFTRYVCKCGFKYLVDGCGNVTIVGKCLKCGNTIGGPAYNKPAAGNTRLDASPVNLQASQTSANDQVGYIGESANQNLDHSVRSLIPASYRILHLIVHALIGASEPQPALTFLQKNDKTATDSEKYCMDHIRSDWEVLKKLLNCSDGNLALMFHSLISSMIEKPPLPNQQIRTSAERERWEIEFHRNYIAPQIKNITETATNYRMKLNEALTKNQKNNLIEGEISQTIVMDKQYRSENLPSLWRTTGIVNFDSFRAYYMSDSTRKNDYPFLSVFFKYSGQLGLLKHLFPIAKFVQILNSKLGYQLTRQAAKEMTFRQFIEKESNDGENREILNSLKTAFEEFKLGWEEVVPLVKRYQCHDLPNNKPTMSLNLPVIFGLMEQKDEGIILCAIFDYLVNIQNNFLREVIAIPPGTCRSLKFLDEQTFDVEQTVSKAKPNTPNGYCLQFMPLDNARSGNLIDFDWDDEILAYSQRNLGIARGGDVVYDLTKIEVELANLLVFEKVHIETQPESQLYLETFPYHMELFQGCMRILSDVKNLITQEPIPIEKMGLLGVSGILDNASEILSSLEILICFVKRTAVGDGDKSVKDYVSQWMKLSSLYENSGFSRILNIDLRLKHLVSLYEFVEEQDANARIKYIDEKYKVSLSVDMEDAILQSVNFELQNSTKETIPAEAFALALKRFMLRFLTIDNQKEMEPLHGYLKESSLNFWPPTIPENLIDELFPENLLVANTYSAYEFTMSKIEQTKKKQANIRNQAINPTTNKTASSRKPKRGRSSKFDTM